MINRVLALNTDHLPPDLLDISWKVYDENSAFSLNDLKNFPSKASNTLEQNGLSPTVYKNNSQILLDKQKLFVCNCLQ